MFKLPDGRNVQPGNAFEYNGNLYPSNWIQHATTDERAAIGLVEIIEQPRPDDRFYFVNEDGNGGWQSTPKDVAQIKKMLIAAVKAYVSSSIAPSDWRLLRELEDVNNKKTSAAIRNYRKALRTNGDALEAEINALPDTAACAAWSQHGWPVDPDAPVMS